MGKRVWIVMAWKSQDRGLADYRSAFLDSRRAEAVVVELRRDGFETIQWESLKLIE